MEIIDLPDAYYTVPVLCTDQKHLYLVLAQCRYCSVNVREIYINTLAYQIASHNYKNRCRIDQKIRSCHSSYATWYTLFKAFAAVKNTALKKASGYFDSVCILNNNAQIELQWWEYNMKGIVRSFNQKNRKKVFGD